MKRFLISIGVGVGTVVALAGYIGALSLAYKAAGLLGAAIVMAAAIGAVAYCVIPQMRT